MERRKLRRTIVVSAIGIFAGAAFALGTVSADAAQISRPSVTQAEVAPYRQLIGQVDESAYLEASVPSTGSYVIEYDVSGVAAFDTYVNGTELGYVGGPTGAYQTRAVQLTAGGQLVQVVGPEGSGTASVYIVQVD